MKTTLAQDSPADQRNGALSSQKNPKRRENGLSNESSSARNVKLQTSFPPIHFSLRTPTRSMDRSHKDHVSCSNISRDARGQKINLPQVEKAVEKIPRSTKHVPAADKSKLTMDLGRNLRPHSSTPLVPLDNAKETKLEKQTWLDVPPQNVSSERLSPETPTLPECPTCKKERRIRNDYDKIIVQSKLDKELLQQRITELEAEQTKWKEEGSNKQQETQGPAISGTCYTEQQTEDCVNPDGLVALCENKLTCSMNGTLLSKLEEENRKKQDQIDSLLIEIEGFKSQLNKIQANEKAETQKMGSKHSKLALDVEELKSQFQKTQEVKKLQISDLEQEKESLLLLLESTESELEKLKKRKALPLSELRKEKDACLAEIEDLKASTEKMRAENSLLLDKIHIFEQELAKRTLCSCLSTYAIPSSTEMLVISHQVSQQGSFSIGTGLRNYCCSSHGGAVQDFCTPRCAESLLEEEPIRFKDMYKQLKRERNLLLDVMEIMYTRRWFLEEAVPHVKRALRKCGVISEDGD